MDYDASQIPAEWYGWMHYKVNNYIYYLYRLHYLTFLQTDLPPIRDGCRPKYKWLADHSDNLSGTKGKLELMFLIDPTTMLYYSQLSEAYMPYSTTPAKVEAWQPPKPCKKQ